jgi:hypothetical protein
LCRKRRNSQEGEKEPHRQTPYVTIEVFTHDPAVQGNCA